MDNLYDRADYLREDATRIEVAQACRGRRLTKVQIARALGRDPGSISAIRTLETHGVLEPQGRAPSDGRSRGGKTWKLSEDWHAALDEATLRQLLGAVSEGTDLVLIPNAQTARACDVIAGENTPVSWGIPLQGEQMGLLLCPSSRPDEGAALQLLDALDRGDVRPLRLHVPRVLARDELRAWARGIVGEAGGPALPSPR